MIRIKRRKTVAIFHEVRRNSHSIAPIFVDNIGSFGKLKIIVLEQSFHKGDESEKATLDDVAAHAKYHFAREGKKMRKRLVMLILNRIRKAMER